MGLSSDLISQFVKITNDKKEVPKETTVYGTVVDYNGKSYVQMDGSELLTPVSTTTDLKDGERVTVMIKNHTATVTGNITSPSASGKELRDAVDTISEFEIIIAKKADVEALNAEKARIDTLTSDNVTIKEMLTANSADIDKLQTSTLTITENLTATEGQIVKLQTEKIDTVAADAKFATIENLEVINETVYNLNATYAEFASATADRLTATEGDITELNAKKLDVETAAITYANVDFSNIGKAAMEYFYAQSGLIENVTVGDGVITGNLIGVTIKGDLIEGNTVIADKLVIQGEDGLYYKLNTDGMSIDGEQTEYNSLNGQIILAKSITAEQINVNDLVAFDATIGGFNITEDAIFSDVKDDEGNTTRGTYIGKNGQVNFGDANNYIKYYQAEDGTWKLAISADTILYDINGDQHSIADLGIIGEYVKIGTYEDEPAIELGESDSDFKMVITNTRILFMEGTGVPAYVSNQSLYIKKAIIETELQQGGFVWTVRKNGNLGLIWKGVIS